MNIAHSRRGLLLVAPILAAFALLIASPAHAAIDCDLQPTAPICNRDNDPAVTPGGTGGSSANLMTVSRTDEVGAGQFVSTSATINRSTLMMNGTTRVWTTNWFWGFHGCVAFDFLSANGTVLLHSQTICQGVDGTAIGVSDRSTSFAWHLYPYMATQLASVRIIHTKL
jgi:hypothetical protein